MIYADYNGSSPLIKKNKDYLLKRLEKGPYGNPNAIHSLGKKMALGLEKCRTICADSLGANNSQIIFNSGSSEGISQVLFSTLFQTNKRVVLTSDLEHAAVVNGLNFWKESNNIEIIKINVLSSGVIDLSHFEALVKENSEKISLVCIMAANNETGVIQPYEKIAEITSELNIKFFCDTTQIIGKLDFNFKNSKIDFAVMSGHKVGALVGSGILLAQDRTLLKPLIFGGGQELDLRGGTQNYIGIESLAIALSQGSKDYTSQYSYQCTFEKEIMEEVPEVKILGSESTRLPGTSLISYPGIHGQAVQIELESQDIFVTTSSACSDNYPETSKVLKSMGINDQTGRGVVRVSFSSHTSKDEYQLVKQALINAYKKLRKVSSY